MISLLVFMLSVNLPPNVSLDGEMITVGGRTFHINEVSVQQARGREMP